MEGLYEPLAAGVVSGLTGASYTQAAPTIAPRAMVSRMTSLCISDSTDVRNVGTGARTVKLARFSSGRKLPEIIFGFYDTARVRFFPRPHRRHFFHRPDRPH